MTETNRKASATARTRATTKYHKAHYKRMYISTTPEQADYIRETAKQFDISIVQLIINSVNEYRTNHGSRADMAQPEQDPTESPMESEETAGAQLEEETEEETENEIETEETTEEEAEEEEQTAGAEEEPQEDEDEDEDEKPEDIPAFVWEQIQRLKKADKRHTAERKAREAAERKRRRLGEENGEDY